MADSGAFRFVRFVGLVESTLCNDGLTVPEVSPTRESIRDLKGRVEALRGYL